MILGLRTEISHEPSSWRANAPSVDRVTDVQRPEPHSHEFETIGIKGNERIDDHGQLTFVTVVIIDDGAPRIGPCSAP